MLNKIIFTILVLVFCAVYIFATALVGMVVAYSFPGNLLAFGSYFVVWVISMAIMIDILRFFHKSWFKSGDDLSKNSSNNTTSSIKPKGFLIGLIILIIFMLLFISQFFARPSMSNIPVDLPVELQGQPNTSNEPLAL